MMPVPFEISMGNMFTGNDIANRYDEWLTPTVLLVGPDGEELVPAHTWY